MVEFKQLRATQCITIKLNLKTVSESYKTKLTEASFEN